MRQTNQPSNPIIENTRCGDAPLLRAVAQSPTKHAGNRGVEHGLKTPSWVTVSEDSRVSSSQQRIPRTQGLSLDRTAARIASAILCTILFAACLRPATRSIGTGNPIEPIQVTERTPVTEDTGAPKPESKPEVVTVIREYPRRPGAATLEVSPTAALISLVAPEATNARLELQRAQNSTRGRSPRFVNHAKKYPKIRAQHGNTGVYEFKNLTPDTRYRYRLQIGDGDSTDWYYLRTAPAPDQDVPVHFVFGAELSNDPKFDTPLIDTMSQTGASFFLSLGDWPYTDLPVKDVTLDQYRASHRLARLRPQNQLLFKNLPMYAMYDDHDIKNNWNKSMLDTDKKQLLAGLQAWDEFFPLRNQHPDVLARRRYRNFTWGKHAEFFMLDTRLYKSPHKDEPSPEKTILGTEQKAWLQKSLRASRATFKFIVTTVPMYYGTTNEHWSAYRAERAELFAFLHEKRIKGVVFLTGDQHWLSIHHLDSGHREYQVGPLSSFLRKVPEERPENVVFEAPVPNYGEIMILAGSSPQLVFTARGKNGGLLYVDVIRPIRAKKLTPPPTQPNAVRPTR